MNEISYITTTVLKILAEEPGRLVKALEYSCAGTLLIAMLTDSVLRRRRPTRPKNTPLHPAKISRF